MIRAELNIQTTPRMHPLPTSNHHSLTLSTPTALTGKNISSSLCKELAREECAHSVMAFNTTYSNTGLFGVYGVADHHDVEVSISPLPPYRHTPLHPPKPKP